MLNLTIEIAYFFVVIAFAVAAIVLRAIDARGFLASVAVGFAIIFGGGISWFIIVAVFFALGVGFTWYKYGYKKQLGSAQEKGGSRSWPNILANGGMASVFALGELVHPDPAFAALFLGSISAAAADTAATELGLLNKKPPRMITRPSKEVPPGTSGGISLLGYVGAFIASFVIGLMAVALGAMGQSLLPVPVCLVGGIAGATADSALGATMQRQGYCKVCHRQTEALTHCGEKTAMTGGVAFVENNVVNLVATLVGGLFSLALLLLV